MEEEKILSINYNLKRLSEKGTPYWWLNDESLAILNRGYLLKGETVQDAVKRISLRASEIYGDKELLHIFEEIISKGWLGLSSPIWANFGTSRGLPISCFGSYLGDSIKSITTKLGEVIMQTKIGGGTSGYFGELRGRGASITDNGKSNGAVAFMEIFDSAMKVISQGGTRKGSFASYLDIDHPDIEEFLTIKDIGSPIQNLFYGVCVPDYWLNEMIEGDEKKREIWSKILESRQHKGLPYIFFTDNVNKNKPDIYKKLNLTISQSNLCSEICLPNNIDESFVCCLSSMNLELYDEWKDTKAVQYAIWFLDAVMEDFISKSNTFGLKQAHRFAKRHRALGLGVMGLHSYYQKIGRPFGHPLNIGLNKKIFSYIKNEVEIASKELGELYGYAPIFDEVENFPKELKKRNTTLLAIAPTTSNSAILSQTSPGIEPYSSNYYKVNLAKGNFIRKNKYLEKLLEEKGCNNEDVWREIMIKQGSVQHLDYLTQEEKDIFKTFKEISQADIIQQAAVRQQYIDQSQSLNINIPPDIPPKEVNKLILDGWKQGIKTFYYQRSQSVTKELLTNIVSCSSCEG